MGERRRSKNFRYDALGGNLKNVKFGSPDRLFFWTKKTLKFGSENRKTPILKLLRISEFCQGRKL